MILVQNDVPFILPRGVWNLDFMVISDFWTVKSWQKFMFFFSLCQTDRNRDYGVENTICLQTNIVTRLFALWYHLVYGLILILLELFFCKFFFHFVCCHRFKHVSIRFFLSKNPIFHDQKFELRVSFFLCFLNKGWFL